MRKRRLADGDDADSLRWLATYGDVVTLLLAFFVLLYAISQVDQRKFQLFVSGLETPFGNQSASSSAFTGGNGLASDGQGPLPADRDLQNVDGLGLIDGGANVTYEEPPEGLVPPETTIPLPPEDVLRTAEDLQALRERVSSDLVEAGFVDLVGFEVDARGLVIAIATDDVLFPSGAVGLSSVGLDIVEVIAPSLADFRNTILVEGHTDDIPLDLNGYDNWNLSTDRAIAVLHVLVDEFGLSPDRLAASGFAEFQPRASNETAEGRSLNRRVELVIVAETE